MEEALKAKQDPTKMMDNYQPLWVEKYWYKYWETKNYFHPDAEEALKTDKRYVMVIPPPK
jgi:valyl-tRNA synthetase